MRLSAIFREAARNIVSGTTRFTVFCAALAIVICVLTLGDSLTIAQQVTAANDFRRAGGATLILTAQSRINGTACQNLTDIPGVSSAGALRESSTKVTMSTLPDAPVALYEVSGGFPAVLLVSDANGSGLILSADIARTLRVSAGDVLSLESGNTRVAATYLYPADGRRPGLGYAALTVSDNGRPFDECWATSWPQITNLRALLLSTIEPDHGPSDDRPTVSPLNSSLGQGLSGTQSFLDRSTRGGTPLAGAVALLLGFISVRARRLQLASALHSGVRRLDVLGAQLLEACSWCIPAALLGIGTAVVSTHFAPIDDQQAVFRSLLGVSLASFAGAVTGAVLATIATREKQLFRYFKDR